MQYREVLRHRQARLLYGLVVLEGAFVNGGFTYLGAYLSDRFGISYLAIGVILAGYGAGTLATSRIVRLILRKIGENGLILAGGLLLGGGFLVLKVLPWWPAFILPVIGMGAGFALFHSTLQVRATELIPALRGTAVALFAFFLFLGSGAGTAVLGWVATTYGYTPLLLASGLGMLAVTALARAVW